MLSNPRPSIWAFALSFNSGRAEAAGHLEARDVSGQAMPIQLVDERLNITIDDQHATTLLRQAYRHTAGRALEGRYQLAAGQGAKVTGFAYWNGEQKIIGELFERPVARQIYEEVTGLGRDPGLLEQHGEGSFSFRVFPIASEERKRVEVELEQYLVHTPEGVEYRFELASDRAEIEVELHESRGVLDIHSPTHELEVLTRNEGRVRLRAHGRGRRPAEGLIIRYQPAAALLEPHAVVHRDVDQDAYLHLSLVAPQGDDQGPRLAKDVTLVLDKSGSMAGLALEQAKQAAEAIVLAMGEDEGINVIAFDDGVDALYEQPQTLDAATRRRAIAYISGIRDEGGTDIAGALEATLQRQVADERPDVVIFVTDGQSDAQSALKIAESARVDVRIFTVGVGEGVESALLSMLAKQNRGRFTHLARNDQLEQRMRTLYQQIAEPLWVDLQIEAEGGRLLRMYPPKLPDLYPGQELRVVARASGPGPLRLRLSGLRGTQPVRRELAVALTAKSRPWVGRQWAQARVEHLLELIALRGPEPELEREATELALVYNLVTPYTAFLAIPESELGDRASGYDAALRRKRALLAQNPDAVALSRAHMPPGDPVISVRAPADAEQVTAYFPFGLVRELQWDAKKEHWSARFLVPTGVEDGVYRVRVVIVGARGQVRVEWVEYTIDAEAPDIDLQVRAGDSGKRLHIVSDEPLRELWIVEDRAGARRQTIPVRGHGRSFEVGVKPGLYRVVASDMARNERVLGVEVTR